MTKCSIALLFKSRNKLAESSKFCSEAEVLRVLVNTPWAPVSQGVKQELSTANRLADAHVAQIRVLQQRSISVFQV